MAVKLLGDGYVGIEPDILDWTDILAGVRELLDTHGWIKHESGDLNKGMSLHGAIGHMASELTGEGKDRPVARTLREDTNRRLEAQMPVKYRGITNSDIAWNDDQRGKASVLKLIDKTLAAG